MHINDDVFPRLSESDIDDLLNGDDELENTDEVIEIDTGDGTVITINLPSDKKPDTEESDFDDNLAEYIDDGTLRTIASTLIEDIEADDQSRSEWLENYAQAMDLLGNKVELPSSGANSSSTVTSGQSTVRNPLLLEACIRFQANSRGELLPAGGPVKIRNDGKSNKAMDQAAQALETDFNHYLTSTATEYYPDTDKMLFKVGFGGMGFKKVFYCPIRRRPVSESVPVEDIIVNDAESSLDSCGRITHQIRMRPSTLKRMQLLKVYRNVPLVAPSMPEDNPITRKANEMQGVTPHTEQNPMDNIRTIYECYCELDLADFPHKENGKPTGLPLPYRVTIDKETQVILEIRRWWKEDDDRCLRKEVFVDYIFEPAFGFYGWGLKDILGNTTLALTAAWRLALDSAMYANFPGFLYSKQLGRNNSNEFMVPPGGGAPIDTGGMPINQVIMPLPYKDVSPAFINLMNEVQSSGQRLGGVTELQVGEGNANAPVGSVIAMIEQATVAMSAVHKRLHAAQSKEFKLLIDLFKQYPSSFWEGNKAPEGKWDDASLILALNTNTIVPSADPNTASQAARVQKCLAILQLANQQPELYDIKAVHERCLDMVGIDDYQSLFNQNPVAQGDPAKEAEAQAKMMDAQSKLKMAEAKQAEVGVLMKDAEIDGQNRQADRESRERLAVVGFAKDIAMHPESAGVAMPLIMPMLSDLQNEG